MRDCLDCAIFGVLFCSLQTKIEKLIIFEMKIVKWIW